MKKSSSHKNKRISSQKGLKLKQRQSSNRKSKSTNRQDNKETSSFTIVAIGASAGGLEGMTELLKYLAPDTGMAFIYVQHLSPQHESILASLLAKSTTMKVQQAVNKEKMLPNNVYVIPPNTEMFILDGHIKITKRPDTPKVSLPIDILFTSLADKHKENVIGIILSGNATDGTRGLQAIKHEGGLTFAQDDSAKFSSMPKNAIAASAVDFVLSPRDIANELGRLSKHPLVKLNDKENGQDLEIDDKNPKLKAILTHLYNQSGVDFSLYKTPTIKRRIQRRIMMYKLINLTDYLKLITEKKEETEILYKDLLITVTSFFRDKEACHFLKNTLLPRLLKSKSANEPLRIWIAGCSSGEEAYSIAMMLCEIQDNKYRGIQIQIFATDLSATAISKARIGIYSKHELENISPKQLDRFFTKSNGNFRIAQLVRDMCVFAPHNILRDAPFSRIDFISCCNLLIYFDTVAQKKTIETFHYAIKENGYLMLGKSEGIGQSTQHFSPVNKTLKIFQRKKNSGIGARPEPDLPITQQQLKPEHIKHGEARVVNIPNKKNILSNNGLDDVIDSVLLTQYVPASVVVTKQLDIMQFRGATELYLTHTAGKASLNILKMARPEIAFELRNCIAKAIKSKKPIEKKNIEINGGRNIVTLEVMPLAIENEPLLFILFKEQQLTGAFGEETPIHRSKTSKKTVEVAKDRKIRKLEEEMSAYREELNNIIHNHEAAMEEFQSVNEEVVSSNEELRSVNEELETSKEEIQSANEELVTTNEELQARNELINELYTYSDAIISTIHDPMIVLDAHLRVKTANKGFYKKFAVKEEQTEGAMLYELGDGQWNIPQLHSLLEEVLQKNSTFYDFEVQHNFPGIGEKTMLLNARRVIQKSHQEQLILLSIADVTERKKLEHELQQKEIKELESKIENEKRIADTYKIADTYIRNVFMQAPVSIVVYKGSSFTVDMINEKGLEMWGTTYADVINKPLFEISPEMRGQKIEKILTEVYLKGEPFIGEEIPGQYFRNGIRHNGYFNFAIYPVHDLSGTIVGLTAIGTDVTQEVLSRNKIEDSERAIRRLLEFDEAVVNNVAEGLYTVDTNGMVTMVNAAAEKLFGWTKEELLGKKMHDITHYMYPDGSAFPAEECAGLQGLTNGNVLTDYEDVFIRKDGTFFDVMYSSSPIMTDGKISGLIVAFRDITESKRAVTKIRENEQQFNTLANNIQNLAWIADGGGSMFWFNQRWYDFTGTTLDESKGNDWQNLIRSDHRQPVVDFLLQAWRKEEPWELTFPLCRYDGVYEWYLTRAVPLTDAKGKIFRWIGTNTNIEKQKMQALEFENAVKQRTEELQQTNKILEEKNSELEKLHSRRHKTRNE